MNVNFGLFPPLAQMPNKHPDGTRLRGTEKTVAKRRAICARALADLDQWIGGARIAAEVSLIRTPCADPLARRAPQRPLPPPLRQVAWR